MNRHYHALTWLILIAVLLGAGCEDSQQSAYSDIEGLTLADLQAKQVPVDESLLSFSVLTYTVDPNSLDSLQNIVDALSQESIRYDNQAAFAANGFTVGRGLHEQGAQIAQKLQEIGSVRTSQSALMIPTNSDEILFGTDIIGQRTIIYSTSATGAGGAAVESGKLGWIMSGSQDPDSGDVVQVTLCPAFWEIGASDLRLLTGEEPYQFRFFDVGRCYFELNAGEFCLLAPQRFVKDQETLDRLLFEIPRREKVRFFVIIFGGERQIDGE